jgi:hypothetical protein
MKLDTEELLAKVRDFLEVPANQAKLDEFARVVGSVLAVYYTTRKVPKEYRAVVREALLVLRSIDSRQRRIQNRYDELRKQMIG